jgi:heptosyltransferase III
MLPRQMAQPSTDSLGDSGLPRVLVIFPGALGDLICFVPALRALERRHRGAAIELMAREELGRFAVGRIGVARAHSIDRREVAMLFAESGAGARGFFGAFQRIYSFFAAGNRNFREALVIASDAKLSFHPFRPDGAGHVAAAYLHELGEPADSLECRIKVLSQDLDAAARRLSAHGLRAGRFALLLPGSGSAEKNWPAVEFAELARRLQPRIAVAIAIGPAEAALASSLAETGCAILADMELGELAGIAASAALFVGNDSGVSHLAAAAGAPGIALFGPTDPARWRPLSQSVRVLRRTPLVDLNTDQVTESALQMLGLS